MSAPPPDYLQHFARLGGGGAGAGAAGPAPPPPPSLFMPPEMLPFAHPEQYRQPNRVLQLPDDLLALKNQYIAYAREATHFLRARATGARPPTDTLDPAKRAAFETLWREQFIALNATVTHADFCGRSLTDVGFIGLCAARVAERPQLHPRIDDGSFAALFWGPEAEDKQLDAVRALVPLARIWEVFVWMGVQSCTHTAKARAIWPDAGAVEAFRWDAALLVHVFFGRSGLVRAHLMQRIHALDPAAVPVGRAGLWKTWKALRVPKLLKDKQDVARAQAAQRKAKRDAEITALLAARSPLLPGAADEDRALFWNEEDDDGDYKETAEEDQGFLWRSSSEELVGSFQVKVQRLLYELDLTALFLQRYPEPVAARGEPDAYGPTGPVFDEATYKGLCTWLEHAYRNDQDEALTKFYRALAMQLFFPLGWETMASRDRLTAAQTKDPQLQLQAELGADLSGLLFDRTQVMHHAPMLSDPDYGDALMFAQFEFAYRQKTNGVEFVSEFMCLLPFARDTWAKRFAAAHHRWQRAKRPVIVWLRKRWWVFYRQRMHPCLDARTALLFWLFVMDRDFSVRRARGGAGKVVTTTTTEDGTDVAPLVTLFNKAVPRLRADPAPVLPALD